MNGEGQGVVSQGRRQAVGFRGRPRGAAWGEAGAVTGHSKPGPG